MRTQNLRLAALSAAVIGSVPFGASAQLEEIVVTATRRRRTCRGPLSIQAFTAEQLELGGITNGLNLGVMVPNVVLIPGTAARPNFDARGLPGVGLCGRRAATRFGFQQSNFVEMNASRCCAPRRARCSAVTRTREPST